MKSLKTKRCLLASALTLTLVQPVWADSIWSDTNAATMFTDRRQLHTIGGLLTVVVDERVQASQDSNTRGNKQVKNDHKWQAGLGAGGAGGNNGQVKLENQIQANGTGSTSRNGTLALEITAQIEEILPNGNLVIRGKKQIRVNDEISDIMLSGIVRRDDVDKFNRISSESISDLKLDVKGTGPVSAKSTGGLLWRLFNFLL